jgi:hypothetical protein
LINGGGCLINGGGCLMCGGAGFIGNDR